MAKIGVVFNPSKLNSVEEFKQLVVTEVTSLHQGTAEVLFFETTVEDTGKGQAQQALADGCTQLIVAGGDGTVRMVAGAVAESGSRVSLGIIPAGTGNLLARNLDVPINKPIEALRIALQGEVRPIDIGWISYGIDSVAIMNSTPEPFIVIAGFGFDAVVMEQTDAKLKKYVGWVAYLVAGIKNIVGRGQNWRISLDNAPAMPLQARTVMIGNVGKLQGGVNLMPEADAASGELEILALNWHTAAGFGQVIRKVLFPKTKWLVKEISSQNTFRAKEISVSTRSEMPMQIDGDFVGNARHLYAKIMPQAVNVRIGPEPKYKQWLAGLQERNNRLFKAIGANKE